MYVPGFEPSALRSRSSSVVKLANAPRFSGVDAGLPSVTEGDVANTSQSGRVDGLSLTIPHRTPRHINILVHSFSDPPSVFSKRQPGAVVACMP